MEADPTRYVRVAVGPSQVDSVGIDAAGEGPSAWWSALVGFSRPAGSSAAEATPDVPCRMWCGMAHRTGSRNHSAAMRCRGRRRLDALPPRTGEG